MNLEQLTYLVEALRTGTISRAAETLHISPTSISRGLSDLEREFNMQILIRNRQGVQLTKEGATIINQIYKILNDIDDLYAQIYQQKHTEITINCIAMLSTTIMSRAISVYTKLHPGTNVMLYSNESTQQIINNISVDQRFDFGLIGYTSDLSSLPLHTLDAKVLFYNPLRALCSTTIAANYPNDISIDELLKFDWVGWEEDSFIFKEFLKLCKSDTKPRTVLSTNNTLLISQFIVQNPSTVGFLTELFVRYQMNSSENVPIVPVKIRELRDEQFPILVISRKDHPIPPEAETLLNCLCKEVNNMGFVSY